MERIKMEELVRWKEKPGRKPLILKGARQVGKTWLMKEFGERYFDQTAYVNLDRNSRMRRVFDGDFDVEAILMALNIETGVAIQPERTLIILDEIQEAPRAISALKYFCEDAPEYAIVAAGSLLGVAIHEGASFPVGKVDTMDIHPLNYREFLIAMGERPLADLLMQRKYTLMEAFAEKYIRLLKLYLYTGGMPEVVDAYAQRRDIVEVRSIQRTILELYEDDFGKHAPKEDLPRIRMVWNAVPLQLAKENKKFFFGQVKAGARARDFEKAIQWLTDCGLLTKVYRVEKPAMPLKSYIDFAAFKIYMLDVGLLGPLSDLDARAILEESEIFVEFKGALAEQYVLQQLISDTQYTPYYYSVSSHNEIDFVLQREGQVVPLEVKAAENLRSKSLRAYCDKFKPVLAVRTSLSGYREQEWMTNLPLYAVMTL